MDNKIFLKSHSSKQATDVSGAINVSLKGNRKLLPLLDVSDTISQYDQYMDERGKCNKIRLTCQINTVCSNVLFNKVTEVVKDEGSSNVVSLNYSIGENSAFDDVKYKKKNMSFWSSNEMRYQSVDAASVNLSKTAPISTVINNDTYSVDAIVNNIDVKHPTNSIRDTQLSNCGFVYKCGLDFFNNHLLRSNTFRTICKCPNSDMRDYGAFNTIADLMRDTKGHKVCEKYYYPTNANVEDNAKFVVMHMYDADNLDTFDDAVKNKLIVKHNGWVGFKNDSRIKAYMDFLNSDPLGVERPLMGENNSGDFIDMFPSRDFFSFIPKYNKFQHRLEKNWNYCITYPSSSCTAPFSDIIECNDGVNSLKAIYFDENTRNDNGTSQLVIYGISKHGLNEGDYVNIYKTYNKDGKTITEEILDSAEVKDVVDDFIFTVFSSDIQISNEWISVSEKELKEGKMEVDNIKYVLDNETRKFFYKADNNGIPLNNSPKYYIVNESYVNLDDNAQNISYKKTVGGIECEYYVRIFSKLPNFKFSNADTSNEYELYKNDSEVIKEYQKHEYEFENHLSRLAFAKNIYGDDVSEIVFTDDIDLSHLKDNLGRPLTSLYLTLIKNNQGYKEWYGYDCASWNEEYIRSKYQNIEFSHCFGKVTCGIQTSEESMCEETVHSINRINVDTNIGYDVSVINGGGERASGYTDASFTINSFEVSYLTDNNFYGDLCYYDGYNAIERSIQNVLHRFNTAQRECENSFSNKYFKDFIYDEIGNDDYDSGNNFVIKANKYTENHEVNSLCSLNEGYYYNPHYEIPIKTFGKINTIMPDFLTIRQLTKVETSCGIYNIVTKQQHFLSGGDKATLYDRINERYYILKVLRNPGNDFKSFTCEVHLDSNPEEACDITSSDTQGNENVVHVLKVGDEIYPSYKLFKIDNLEAPNYVKVLKDGSCRLIWRNVINNGMGINKGEVEEYPFTNGSFYVNKSINLYVRRQDPYDIWGMRSEVELLGNDISIEDENEYVKDSEIEC